MQLLIIGALEGQVGAASQIAMARGAKVSHVDTVPAGLEDKARLAIANCPEFAVEEID